MNVKKVVGSILLAATVIGFSQPPVYAKVTDIRDYPRVAVMNIGNKAITSRGLRHHDLSMATEYALYELSNSGWFDLIDYESLNSIAQMHSINMSGMVDTGTAVQLGKFAGAEYMIIGNVTGLTVKENVASAWGGNAKAGVSSHVVTANVVLRIVDIETGRIVKMGMGKDSSTSTLTEIGFRQYKDREVLRSKNIGSTVVNDIRDEVVKQNTTNKNSTKDTDYRDINSNKDNNYNRTDDRVLNDSYQNSGKTSAEQSGNSNSIYTNDGRRDRDYEYNDRINDERSYDKVGGSDKNSYKDKYDNEHIRREDTHESEWKEGGSGIHTWGGPTVGVTKGKNQDMTWNRTHYHDEGEYGMYSRGGDASSKDTADYRKNRDEHERAGESERVYEHERSDRDYDRNVDVSDSERDSRVITDRDYYKNQQKSDYQNQGNRHLNDQNTTTINDSEKYNYKNQGGRTHDSQNDYEDTVSNKANNRLSVDTESKYITYEREVMHYGIMIGTVEVSEVQVVNAISKAMKDAIYGKTGLMTNLNGGKKLKL